MRSHSYSVYHMSSSNTSAIHSDAINCLITSQVTSSINDAQAKQEQSSQLLQSPQVQQSSKKFSTNILLVDDEPDTLFTYESFLSDEGYNVKAFTDSLEALKHFVQIPDPSSYYNLAVLDIRMPKLNGLQLFHKMKTLSPKIKIMFCSALDIAEELIGILPDIQHEHIIRKPLEREYFINKIKSALNK
jgi:two-component system, OmpR family, response regulator ChvI